MYAKEQAKLYYLYMMEDGDISENEKKIFKYIIMRMYVSRSDSLCR